MITHPSSCDPPALETSASPQPGDGLRHNPARICERVLWVRVEPPRWSLLVLDVAHEELQSLQVSPAKTKLIEGPLDRMRERRSHRPETDRRGDVQSGGVLEIHADLDQVRCHCGRVAHTTTKQENKFHEPAGATAGKITASGIARLRKHGETVWDTAFWSQRAQRSPARLQVEHAYIGIGAQRCV